MPYLDCSIDLHYHPQYNPLGKSYNAIQGVQSEKPNEKASISLTTSTLADPRTMPVLIAG